MVSARRQLRPFSYAGFLRIVTRGSARRDPEDSRTAGCGDDTGRGNAGRGTSMPLARRAYDLDRDERSGRGETRQPHTTTRPLARSAGDTD